MTLRQAMAALLFGVDISLLITQNSVAARKAGYHIILNETFSIAGALFTVYGMPKPAIFHLFTAKGLMGTVLNAHLTSCENRYNHAYQSLAPQSR